MANNQSRSMGALDFGKGAFCHLSLQWCRRWGVRRATGPPAWFRSIEILGNLILFGQFLVFIFLEVTLIWTQKLIAFPTKFNIIFRAKAWCPPNPLELLRPCLLFIVFIIMNWMDKCSQADECATIGNCKISRLLFADDLVLLLPQNLSFIAH